MKLKTKLLFAYQGIALILLIAISIFFSVLFFNEKISTSQDQMADRMTLINAMIRNTVFSEGGEVPQNIKEYFEESHWIEMGLFSTEPAQLLFKTKHFPIKDIRKMKPAKLYNTMISGTVPESLMMDSANKNLWGYTVIPDKKMVVVGYIPSAKIYRILYLFALKLVIIALFSIGLVSIFAQYFSTKLTDYISYIKNQIALFGTGKFDSRVTKITQDELGEIAGNFNTMAKQIIELVDGEKHRAFLENEILTAQRVQNFFFPPFSYASEKMHIQGHYEAAEYCGGDWWFYHELDDRMYVLIGDVTGHGTPSAMVTSSCRSVVANVFYHTPKPSPNMLLEELSHSINSTVRGDLNMTMCVICYHYDTKELTYSNASHEMPFYWPLFKDEIKRKDIEFLTDIHGPRLGQFEKAEYGISTKKFNNPVRILLYSDGLTELTVMPSGFLGERALIKSLVASHNELKSEGTASTFYAKFHAQVKEHNGGAVYADDLSYLVVDIREA